MAMWFYQLSQKEWTPEAYRLVIWEGERWRWLLRAKDGKEKKIWSDARPKQGDTIVFFFAEEQCHEPGFYGWAVILLDWSEEESEIHFRPVAPSDQLKMRPWWEGKDGGEAKRIANEVRVPLKKGTLWPVTPQTLQKTSARESRAGWAGWRRPAARQPSPREAIEANYPLRHRGSTLPTVLVSPLARCGLVPPALVGEGVHGEPVVTVTLPDEV
jgi:hypothetical protein